MYCIYRITNNINGHTYIGQHKYTDINDPMGKYKGSGMLLKKAYKKYGETNFLVEIMYSRIRDKSTVDAMEIWAIKKYRPEYNIAKGGSGGDTWSGRSVESQNRTRELCRRKCSHHWSEEWKLDHARKVTGKVCSLETRRKMSESRKGLLKGRPSPSKGTHWYNNGTIEIMSNICPDGYSLGRIRK